MLNVFLFTLIFLITVNRVDNPRGVITAQDKFRKNYYKNPFNDEKSILRFLLYWNITYSQRIKMAKEIFRAII